MKKKDKKKFKRQNVKILNLNIDDIEAFEETDIIEDDNTEEDGGKKHTNNKQSFNDNATQLSFFACLLFSLVTQTSVGFAWFVPTDNTTRIIVFFQLISVLCITTYTML